MNDFVPVFMWIYSGPSTIWPLNKKAAPFYEAIPLYTTTVIQCTNITIILDWIDLLYGQNLSPHRWPYNTGTTVSPDIRKTKELIQVKCYPIVSCHCLQTLFFLVYSVVNKKKSCYTTTWDILIMPRSTTIWLHL